MAQDLSHKQDNEKIGTNMGLLSNWRLAGIHSNAASREQEKH